MKSAAYPVRGSPADGGTGRSHLLSPDARNGIDTGRSRPCVALVTAHGWVGISTPVIMTARYLAQRGGAVDLFVDEDEHCRRLGIGVDRLGLKGVQVHVLPRRPPRGEAACAGADPILFDRGFVERVAELPGDYDWLVGFDPHGLIRAAWLGARWQVPWIYHSLEIHDREDGLKALERRYAREALLTLTQDEIRADILARLNQVPRERIAAVPNSSLGGPLPERRDFFRPRLGIPREAVIVLATGTLLPQHGIDRIMRAAPGWPPPFVLVLHGWIPDPEFEKEVRRQCAAHADRLFLSTEILSAENKPLIFQSADIGLVFFSPDDTNLRFAAGSAGKIFDFMQAGVPIVANELPGMRALIEGNRCGKVVLGAEEIGAVLPEIMAQYAELRRAGLKSFIRYGFERAYGDILSRVAVLAKKPLQRPTSNAAAMTHRPRWKFVHLMSMDEGGAAKAALRLQAGLVEAGHESILLVMVKKGVRSDVRVVPPALPSTGPRRAVDRLEGDQERWAAVCRRFGALTADYPRRSRRLELFTDADADTDPSALPEIRQADVIVLHWVSGMLDLADFRAAFSGKRVVWVLHDFNPFTGGCHYPAGCSRYRAGCGVCPQLGSREEHDISRAIWLKKMRVLRDASFSVVAPSRWLAACAASSPILGGKTIVTIPNSVPLDIFRPFPRDALRGQYGLSPREKVILFGADSLDNPRKGFAYLRAAVEIYRQRSGSEAALVCFGRPLSRPAALVNGRLKSAGYIQDEHLLAGLYGMADVFVLPSVEDNCPNTALEALACGTPVAGFRVGGIPEIVAHGITGHLAERLHPEALADSIAWCIEAARRPETRQSCRRRAEEQFCRQRQVRSFCDLVAESAAMGPAEISRPVCRPSAPAAFSASPALAVETVCKS
jgi:glycosyltransferase involved in cell wall biosynthesis